MSALTIPRPDVTAEQVGEALRRGLGPRYTVLPGEGMNWIPLGVPRPDQPGKIAVGAGFTRLSRAEVTMIRHDGQTCLPVIADGTWPTVRLANELWIAPKARSVLRAAPSLR